MIKLAIFDAYGVTLTGGYPQTCKALAKKFNKDWKEIYSIVYTKYFNMAAERKITQEEAWEKAINELNLPITIEDLKKVHYSLMNLNKEVISFVESLNFPTLLLTKNTRDQLNDTEELLGFCKYFDNVINTWEINLPKDSKETYDYISTHFDVKPDEIVYIDDQEQNLVEAKKLGIKTILYLSFNQFKDDFNKLYT